MFPDILLNSHLFGIGLTVITYCLCETFLKKLGARIFPPIALAVPIIITILLFSPEIKYEQYEAGASFITFLLGPATIALALPLIRNWEIIKAQTLSLACGIIISALTAIISVYSLGKIFGLSDQVLISLLPKSVTTPIAMEISYFIGGIPPLTAAAVVFTGVLGAIFNHRILGLMGIKNDLAAGIAIGASSHGAGTSVCASISSLQLAAGGVAIALTGLATSILVPILLPILKSIC